MNYELLLLSVVVIYALYTTSRNTKILSDALIQAKVIEKLEGNDAAKFASEDIDVKKKEFKKSQRSIDKEIDEMIKQEKYKKKLEEESEWESGIKI